MDSKLDLSLPEAPRRGATGFIVWLTLLVGLACLGLLSYQAFRPPQTTTPDGDGGDEDEKGRLKKLGETLEKRTLYDQAAAVWAEYLAQGDMTRAERGKVLFRRGKCLKLAGHNSEAARVLTEATSFPISREDKRSAERHLLDCLSALGKEEVRQNVLRATAVTDDEEEGVVVARVGGDPITREDIREILRRQNEMLLAGQAGITDPEEIRRRAENMASESLKSPQTMQAILQRLISTEVLYREGLARGIAAGPDYEKALQQMRREYVAGRVMEDEVGSSVAAISETDLKNHYEAHKEKYILKPSVEFAYLRFTSEAEAAAAVEALRAGGEKAAALEARFESAAGPAVQGEPLPGLGRSAEATAHLLALDEGATGERAVQIGDAWYVFRAGAKTARQQKSFEEAREQVRRDLALAKRDEALEKLQQSLATKFQVELVEENLKPSAADPEAPPPDTEEEEREK